MLASRHVTTSDLDEWFQSASELFRNLMGLTKLQDPSVPVCDGLLPGIFRLKQPLESLGWLVIRLLALS